MNQLPRRCERVTLRLPWCPERRVPCTLRTWGRRDGEASSRGSWGTLRGPTPSESHGSGEVAVRRVEWRLFGFGMMQFLSCSSPFSDRNGLNCLSAGLNISISGVVWSARIWCPLLGPPKRTQEGARIHPARTTCFSGLYPAAKPRQRLPAGVARTLFAGACLAVTVLTTARAKSFAVRLAQRPDRQGQKHLLAQHILKQKTVLLIITDFRLRRCYGPLRLPLRLLPSA